MPNNRYYLESHFEEDAIVSLENEEWHHLARVTRSRVGEIVELVNGKGQLAEAKILNLNKNEADLCIIHVADRALPPPSLILAQAIPRMNHLEWIVEKGTELNATAFWLFPGIGSEKDTLSANQQTRLKSLTLSAMKQCGRLDLPEIILKPPLLQWPAMEGTLLFGDTDEEAPYLWAVAFDQPIALPLIFFIGPEKGFAPQERQYLLEVLKAKGVRLHPNILRAETAPLAALALVQPYLKGNKS